jgi:hypothetical protein
VAARKKVEESEPSGPGLVVSIWRLFNTLLIIAILLYVAALVAIRTDGVKGLVREKIEERIGLKVAIAALKSDAAFNLVLSTVTGVTTNEQSQAGFEFRDVRLNWDMSATLARRSLCLKSLECNGGTVTFERSGPDWNPEDLAGAGDWVASWLGLPIASTSSVAPGVMSTDSEWAATSLIVSNMDIRWLSAPATTVGEVRSLGVASFPLATPGRYLRHFRLSALYAEAGSNQVRGAAIEWIDAGDTNMVLAR